MVKHSIKPREILQLFPFLHWTERNMFKIRDETKAEDGKKYFEEINRQEAEEKLPKFTMPKIS